MYITYFFKFAACSALLLMLYYWVLEKEKMLTFNRFYLLFSLVFSGLAPLFTFELPLFPPETSALITENALPFAPLSFAEIQHTPPIVSAIDSTQNLTWEAYCWVIYGVITLVLLVRLVKNLYSFWVSIRKNQVKNTDHLKLVLLSRKTTPYSFGSYVFVNQGEYEKGEIESEILLHEQAHIQQRHSLDIVFVELLLVFTWWNPTLWLYRKAIMLNHEFLADDWVLKTSKNRAVYQQLLLQKITQNKNVMLASPFNYLITKKRFKMMNRITSHSRMYALQAFSIMLFGALLFVFSDISFAQNADKTSSKVVPQSTAKADFTNEGVSQAMLDEYQQIIEKYLVKGEKNGKEWYRLDKVSEPDRARLETIFRAMSKEQQLEQKWAMIPPLKPFPPTVLTEKEFDAYKNPKIYGVWIDDKKVPNSVLNKYKASDFSLALVSKLYKNAQATIGFKYKFQLNLMTTGYYEKYRDEHLANKKYWLTNNMDKFRRDNQKK